MNNIVESHTCVPRRALDDRCLAMGVDWIGALCILTLLEAIAALFSLASSDSGITPYRAIFFSYREEAYRNYIVSAIAIFCTVM